jgi:hypothetical protein
MSGRQSAAVVPTWRSALLCLLPQREGDDTVGALAGSSEVLKDLLEPICGIERAKDEDDTVRESLAEAVLLLVSGAASCRTRFGRRLWGVRVGGPLCAAAGDWCLALQHGCFGS